jgi:hypothetical protein
LALCALISSGSVPSYAATPEDPVEQLSTTDSRTPSDIDRISKSSTSQESLTGERLGALKKTIKAEAERYDSVPDGALSRAAEWLEAMTDRQLVSWEAPTISASPEGEVVFEWWFGERKLSVYFGEHEATLLRVWGSSIVDEMSEHDAADAGASIGTWSWLVSGT